MRKKSKLLLCLSLIFLFSGYFFTTDSYAKGNEENKIIEHRFNIPCDKVWFVNFDTSIDTDTIEGNVKITDYEGKIIDTEIQLTNDNKNISVKPKYAYEPGMKYTIYVDKNIKDINQESFLENNFIINFTTSNEKNGVMPVKDISEFEKLIGSVQNSYDKYDDELPISPQIDYSMINDGKVNKNRPDSIISDDEYIYRINESRVEIVKVYPNDEMALSNIIDFMDEKFSPKDIFINDNKLYVIGTKRILVSNEIKMNKDNIDKNETESNELENIKQIEDADDILKEDIKIYSPVFEKNIVKVFVFDINDVENIYQIKNYEVDGNYIKSIIVDSKLYVISNKLLNYYSIKSGVSVYPQYKDEDNEVKNIELNNLYYIPNFEVPNYLNVSCIDLNDFDNWKLYSCLGTGDNIYISEDAIYAAVSNNLDNQLTTIYKFDLTNNSEGFKSTCTIKGKTINQFSMDEYNSYLRIAVSYKDEEQGKTTNSLFILDKELNVVNIVENLAQNQRIKSVRFIENNICFVTDKDDTPVYVVNIEDATQPNIIGYADIPTLGNFICAFDKNHIISIGYDKQETFDISSEGNFESLDPVEDGMKISLYTIGDDDIFEEFSYKIGESGTYSEVLNSQGAIFISKENKLLALPVSVFEKSDKKENEFVFQGLDIFKIDVENGISLIEKISSIDESAIGIKRNYDINDIMIQKIFTIDDSLYSVSNNRITVHDIGTFDEKLHFDIENYLNIKDYIKFKKDAYRINDIFITRNNEVKMNNEYFIELSENVDSGYKWKIKIQDPNILALIDHKQFDLEYSNSEEEYVNHVWKFTPVKVGETKIYLEYFNSLLEEDEQEVKTIEFNVIVEE